MALAQPVVGMAATPDGGGYWLVASDGGIFSFGDAGFFGSTGAIQLAQPVVGMAATPDGGGYWLVASDGGVFSFGDARFFGSTGAIQLAQPVVGMAATPDGGGYWLVASDGGVFSFGDAVFAGSGARSGVRPAPTVAILASPGGHGYWLAASDGTLMAFGDAPGYGSATGRMSAPVVGVARRGGAGLRLAAADGSELDLPLSAAGLAAGSGSFSYLVTNPDGSPARFDPCMPVHYVTNLTEAPPSAASEVSAALGTLAAATGMTFVNDGPTTEWPSSQRAAFQPERDGQRWAPVLIAWATPAQTDQLSAADLGVGGPEWIDEPPGVIVTAEAVINAAAAPTLASDPPGALHKLLLHELGHAVGLGHTTDRTQIMYPDLSPQTPSTYGAGDLAGLAHVGRPAGCLPEPSPPTLG